LSIGNHHRAADVFQIQAIRSLVSFACLMYVTCFIDGNCVIYGRCVYVYFIQAEKLDGVLVLFWSFAVQITDVRHAAGFIDMCRKYG